MEKYRRTGTITLELAETMVQRARERAQEFGVKVNVAVVDAGGNLTAFARMDGAPILSAGIAQRKAYTAVAFGLPTGAWYDLIKDSPGLLHGIPHTPELVIFGGGFPIVVDGMTIGGIGVSGGSEEQDEAAARAALELATVTG